MKNLSIALVLIFAFCAVRAQSYQDAQKLTETFSTDDNLVKTVDMDLTNGLAQIGYLRPTAGTIANTPSNVNTATRIHFTHLDAFFPNTVINKLIMPKSENPNFLDDAKKYYPTEIRKINEGYIVCGYFDDACTKSAFMMKLDNNGSPLNYKAYTITTNTSDYIVLNSVAPVNDGAIDHGFVACGYKWDNTNQRKKAIIVIVDENLSVLATREVNEAAIFVSELSANVFPSSYYNKIDRYSNNELFLVGSTGVVSVAAGGAPDGVAYYRGDILFARCSTNVTTIPAPIIVSSVNLYSNYTDAVELGVGLIQADNIYTNCNYILMADHIVDQFNGSQFSSRNSTILFHGMADVHTNNHSLWVLGGVYGRFDYQYTNHERGVDIMTDNNDTPFILCSYDGVKKPIVSKLIISGGGGATTPQGDDYIGALGGDLVPRDLEPNASGHLILTHYEASPRAEKIQPLGYVSDPFPPHCKGGYHPVATFSHSIQKGPSKTYQTPSILACAVVMEDYEIPIETATPCFQQTKKSDGDGLPVNNKGNSTQLADVKVYPNPAANTVRLEITSDVAATSKLEVVGVNGQVLIVIDNIAGKMNGNAVTVDISSLADGVYFCKITGADGTQLQSRFQKITSR